MGVDIARAALAAGNAVVATGRNTVAVSKADDRFRRIDVLVNNAANFYAGYFEEQTPEQIERQLARASSA